MINLSTSQKIKFASFISKIFIFFLGEKKRIINRNGIRYLINLKEGIDLGIFLKIQNEKRLYKIQKIFKKEKKHIFIDIGSNVGSITLPLANIFYKSKIYSIEPTLYAFSKLKKNISLNPDLKKIIFPMNVLISQKNKKIKYVHSSWNFSQQASKHKIHLGTLKKTSGKKKSLDKIFLKSKKKIDFIKIDVDGYELDVLKSGKKIIKKNKPLIHFEFAPYLYKEFGYSPKILISFIKRDLGYDFYDENFKKIENIIDLSEQMTDRSENFFLVNRYNEKIKKKINLIN